MRSGSWLAASLLVAALMGVSGCGNDCGPGTTAVNGACVPGAQSCGPGTVLQQGACVPSADACGPDSVLSNGQCRDPADIEPDVTEPAEPNGPDPGHVPGMFALPATGAGVTIGGCIDPASSGGPGPDVDLYRFAVAGPTLIELSVDGYGGLVGGFVLQSRVPGLVDSDWRRYGVTVETDRASRQVYLPAAGDYDLAIADSRTLLVDSSPAAGNSNTCYLATVAVLDVPAAAPITATASGTTGGISAFYAYQPGEGDVLFATARAPGAEVLVDLVAMVNDRYRASSSASRARGQDASAMLGDLHAGDEVILVVEPVLDYSVPGASYSLDVFSPAPAPLPVDGQITLPGFGLDPGNHPIPGWAYFDAAAGDIIYLELETDAPAGVLINVLSPELDLVAVLCGPACASYQGYFHAPEAGRYFLTVIDAGATQPGSFQLGARREHIQPVPISPGTALGGQSLNSHGDRFFALDVASFAWLAMSGAPLNGFAGDMELAFYDRTRAGQLDDDVQAYDRSVLQAGTEIGRIMDQSAAMLLRVRDTSFAGGAVGSFDLNVAERPYSDLGTVDESTSVERPGVTLAAGATDYYLVRSTPGWILDVRVSGASGMDPVFAEYDRRETALVTDNTGPDAVEVPLVVVNESADWVAFTIADMSASGGAYDLTIGATAPAAYQSAMGVWAFASICPGDGGAGQVHTLVGDGNPWNWPSSDEGISATPLDVSSAGFRFFGILVNELTVSSNGWLTFTPGYTGSSRYSNQALPDTTAPNAVVAPLWADYKNVTVCTQVAAGRVVVQWQGDHVNTGARVEMQAIMDAADQGIVVVFGPGHEYSGASATIGIEDRLGVRGALASYNAAGNAAAGASWLFTVTP